MAIEFEGLEEVLERLEKLGDPQRLEQNLKKATLQLERAAKQKAPKGEIRNSIQSKVDGLTGEVFTPLEYAPYVEYGTGLFAEGEGGGRQEVPWVYVEGHSKKPSSKKIYTEETANQTVAFLRSQGLPAFKTSGQHPKPYMRPALDESKEEILRILKEGLLDD